MLMRASICYTAVIAAHDLNTRLGDKDWAIFDCRFSLDDTGRGLRDHLEAQIPGKTLWNSQGTVISEKDIISSRPDILTSKISFTRNIPVLNRPI
jgi:hypothetical protein